MKPPCVQPGANYIVNLPGRIFAPGRLLVTGHTDCSIGVALPVQEIQDVVQELGKDRGGSVNLTMSVLTIIVTTLIPILILTQPVITALNCAMIILLALILFILRITVGASVFTYLRG
jgi:hypothetical protein